jgi:hypothetical protein
VVDQQIEQIRQAALGMFQLGLIDVFGIASDICNE